jgi:uncharacterized protein (DUF58 family)
LSGASLQRNAVLLVSAAVTLAIVGDWNGAGIFSGLWCLPAAILLLGLAYESWSVARSRVAIGLQLPGQLLLGRTVAVNFTCGHALHRRATIELAPSAPDSFDIDASVVSMRVLPGATAILERRVVPRRLGLHAWPPMRARIAGPLGLAWWPKQLDLPLQARVVPDLFHSGSEARGSTPAGTRNGVEVGAGAEVLRLREYRSGDAPRVIDWKATARAGRLISREFAQEHRLEIVIVVDAGRASSLRSGTLDRFGHYVNVAARLAQYAAMQEDLVGLVIYADRPLAALAPARGAPAVARLRAVLAASRVERAESNPLYAALRVRSLVRQRSLIVLLTDVDDATVASQLAQAVRLLLPKHLPFIAALASAAAESTAAGPAQAWLDPYRSLAAQQYCIGLERKVRALNALGAPALVAKPEQLERAVFSAYADVRRTKRA